MKRIEAFIQPHRFNKVVAALHALPHFPGFTIVDAHGQGHGRGAGGHYAFESGEGLLYHHRQLLIILCEDTETSTIARAIADAAHTGKKGDGLVVVTDVFDVLKIRDAGDGA